MAKMQPAGNGLISRLHGWVMQPFSTQMDLTGWALFVGLILVLAFLWTRVLAHIEAE